MDKWLRSTGNFPESQAPVQMLSMKLVVWSLITVAAWIGLGGPVCLAQSPDTATPLPAGLRIWLDANAPVNGRKPGDLQAQLKNLTGGTADFVQPDAQRQPRALQQADTWFLRFDGENDYLRLENTGLRASSVSVFLVAAPHSNAGDFRGLFAANAPERRDYESGFTLDLGPGPGRALDQINVEGRGFGGANDLLTTSAPFGTVHVLEMVADAAARRIQFRMDGRLEGERSWESAELALEQLTLGARYYTNGPGAQQVRGPFQGDLAELLVFDRVVSESEAEQLRNSLRQKYAKLAADLPGTLPTNATVGVPLVPAVNPPPIQMLVPGFDVTELPVQLTNVNNVRYREDGVLVTLGYNGDLHHLRDTNSDGIEDSSRVFYKNTGSLRGPIGLLLTPPGYSYGRGAFVASKGKVTLITDTDGDDIADSERVVATGWQEIAQNVDATGLAMGPDGSLYFGLGTANYANAWLVDEQGRSAWDIHSDRGTVQRVSPDFSVRETICTGIRFPIAFAFNQQGDLFCTDQEGATWLSNGNPLDELLHIRLDAPATGVNPTGRQHFGFPPRHPKYNPEVIDEPSTFDFGPQHQSTCGMVFNQSVNGGPVFGPGNWSGDALIAGESRGKIWRTTLIKSDAGYIAKTQLIACLQMLTVDQCVSPAGDLIVACHSGPPDWGTGPTGTGRLFRVRMTQPRAPRPVAAWSEGARELRVAFDRHVDPAALAGLADQLIVEYGQHVRAGDRFESLIPPYAVVRAQQLQPRQRLVVGSAALTTDLRTLVINTEPIPARTHVALSLPWKSSADGERSVETPQHPQMDVDLSPTGVQVRWGVDAASPVPGTVSGWIPHPDLLVSRTLTQGSAGHDGLWELLQQDGTLELSGKLDLRSMLRPAIQPGASIDYEWPAETVTVTVSADREFLLSATLPDASQTALPVTSHQQNGRWTATWSTPDDLQSLVHWTLTLKTSSVLPQVSITWHTNEDNTERPLPLHRLVLPWVPDRAPTPASEGLAASTRVKELEGGSWGRGRRVFHSEAAGCFKCHAVNGSGAVIGPDLGNMIHRDYASVMRDLQNPGFAINPDYVSQVIVLKDGRVLTGVLRTDGEQWILGDTQGRSTVLDRSQIEEIKPSAVSVMPQGIPEKLSPEQLRDLLTYLMTPPPQMPLDSPLTAPPLRTRAEVAAALEGSQPVAPLRPLHLVLIDGVKDHGPGEHDYPAWKSAWYELLSSAEQLQVTSVREFPDDTLLAAADVLIFFQKGSFSPPRPEKLDQFLQRGGGAVYIHWAVNGNDDVQAFSKRIGLASWGGRIAFRHGPLTLDIHNTDHPIVRNFDRLQLYDESYWKLTGVSEDITLLASSVEDGQQTPQMWVRDHQPGRVFVSIPGHYNWTFDDPLFRILLLRGIAWTAQEPVDRFNDLVTPGARISR